MKKNKVMVVCFMFVNQPLSIKIMFFFFDSGYINRMTEYESNYGNSVTSQIKMEMES